MTEPMLFGAAGNQLLGGGEAGHEAILPLESFYDRLNNILDSKLMEQNRKTQAVHVSVNVDAVAAEVVEALKHVQVQHVTKLAERTIADSTAPLIDQNMYNRAILERRYG